MDLLQNFHLDVWFWLGLRAPAWDDKITPKGHIPPRLGSRGQLLPVAQNAVSESELVRKIAPT